MSTIHHDNLEHTPLLQKVKHDHNESLLDCRAIPPSTRQCILTALWTGTFFCNLNLTMVATLLPSITSEFKESNQASWIGTAYLLSSCTFTPLYGRLCSILGRRAACQIALFASILGALLCAGSRGMVELTVGRFIAGIGAGALQLLPTVVCVDLYSAQERGLPQAFNNFSVVAGLGLGGAIGGILNDLLGWRAAFLCQVPFFVSVTIVITNKLHYTIPGQGQSTKEVLSRIDFGGLIMLFFMIGSTLTWLSTKFNEDLPWADTKVIIPFILSFLSFGFLLVVECCMAREPILPPSLLREKVAVWVSLSNYFLSACNSSVMFFIPLWFQTVSLDSAAIAGLHLLPNSLGMGLGSLVGGWVIHRTGKYTALNLVFGILPFSGLVSFIIMREDSCFIQKWFSVFPIGLGNAVVILAVMIAIQAHLPESLIPCGTAVAQLCRGLGQLSSLAITSAIFQSRLDIELRQRIHAPDADKVCPRFPACMTITLTLMLVIPSSSHITYYRHATGVASSTTESNLTPKIVSEIRHSFSLVVSLPPDLQRAARDAYAASLRTVFIVGTCSMLISYFIRLRIPEAPMEKPSKHVDQADLESQPQPGSEPGSEPEREAPRR